MENNNNFYTLYSILKMDRKKSEWSSKRTELERINFMLEEIEELKQELKNKNPEKIKDEAGDILWNLLTAIVIMEEKYNFTIDDLINHIINKIKTRKPRLFSQNGIIKEEDELNDWYNAKKN